MGLGKNNFWRKEKKAAKEAQENEKEGKEQIAQNHSQCAHNSQCEWKNLITAAALRAKASLLWWNIFIKNGRNSIEYQTLKKLICDTQE